jgi:hypothetical protein
VIPSNVSLANVTVNSIATNTACTLNIEDSALTATNGTVINPSTTYTFSSGNLGTINVDVDRT